ncbi:RnfABCDGE type electron transport complex subunit G [candidate division NPL-UPA2 bacterium]|nr:RnfABCDGE type electron transport complex subunit G [candidate division NPL-UPA2 bacterium]
MREIGRLVLVLTLITLIAALALAQTNKLTKDRIENARREYELRAVKKVLLIEEKLKELNGELVIEKKQLEFEETKVSLYRGRMNEKIFGAAIKTAGKGYGGDIEVVVGLNRKGVITKIEIVDHKETPGLGAKITRALFRDQFKGKSAKNKIKVRKDGGEIDAISGATVSSRGVCQAVEKALKLFSEEKEDILKGSSGWEVLERFVKEE